MQLVTPLEMMQLEELTSKAGISYDQMMEKAGTGLAEHLARIAVEQGCDSILLLCGNGNNGGDCFVAAARLVKQFHVRVCLVNGVPKTRTAYTKYRMMKNVEVLTEQDDIRKAVSESRLIADGVFGIGFRGELSPFVKELFSIINENPDKHCIAVDIPSGGNGLSGAVAEGTPHCTATVTFGAAKSGLFLAPLCENKDTGDVDLDGAITAKDASQVLTFFAESSTDKDISPVDEAKMNKLGDFNSDGMIDAKDASSILKTYAKNSVEH